MPPVSVRTVFGHAAGSLEGTRASVGLQRPVSLRHLAEVFVHDVVFDEPIVTDEPLGGHHTLTAHRDGSWRYRGHFRATGWPSFEVAILTTLGYQVAVPGDTPAAAQVAFTAKGEVHGSNESGARVFAWDKSDVSPLLAAEWEGVRRSTLQRHVEFDTDWFGAGGDIVSFLSQAMVLGSTFARLAWRSCSPGRPPISSGSTSWCCPGPLASSSPPVRRSCSVLGCCFRCSSLARR
jgi:hypothetical protein